MKRLRLAAVWLLMGATAAALYFDAPGWLYWPTFAATFAAAVWWEMGLAAGAAR